MGDRILEVYVDNPSKGNDVEGTDYLFAGDDGADGPVTLDINQTAGAVGKRVGMFPPGDNFFRAKANENSLAVNVPPVSGIVYDFWIDVVNNDVEPVYPTGFTEGFAPLTKNLDGWAAEDWRRYVYNTGTTTLTQIQTEDGTGVLTVTPIDTLPRPVITDFTLTAGADATTQAVLNFTANDDPTPGSGDGRVDLIDVDTLSVFQSDVSDQDVLNNLVPGKTYSFILRQYDLATPVPNISDSSDIEEPAAITMADAAAGTVSILVDTQTSEGVPVANETNESTLVSSVTAIRTGSTAGSVTVDMTLGSRTAIAGTNFVQLVGGAKTLTIPDGEASAALSIVLLDTSSEYDLMFDVYLDEGSTTGGAEIGSVNSALISILGSGGVGDIVDMDFDSSGGTLGYNESAVWNAEDYTALVPGTGARDGETFVEATSSGSVGTNVMVITGAGSTDPLDVESARMDYKVEFGTGGGSISYPATFYLGMRAHGAQGFNDAVWATVDGAVAGAQYLWVQNHSVKEWEWSNAGDEGMVAIVIQEPGTHTINIWHANSYAYLDRFLITSDSSYDPTTVGTPDAGDDGGPIEVAGPLSTSSGTTGGDTVPHPSNPTSALDAPVSGTITALRTVPTSGQTGQLLNINPAAYFNSNNITVLTATLTFNSGADNISGAATSPNDAALFTPSLPLSNGITYEMTFTGMAVDLADNLLKNFTTQWSFTTIKATVNDPNIIINEDFNSIDPSTPLTKAWFEEHWLVDPSVTSAFYTADENPEWAHDGAWIEADPLGDPARGNVLAVWNSANAIGLTDGDSPPSGIHMAAGFAHPDSGTWDEMYLSFDYLRPKINPATGLPYQLMKVQKGPNINIGPTLTASYDTGIGSMRLNQASNHAYPGKVAAGDYLMFYGYRYDVNYQRAITFPDDSDPPIGDPLKDYAYYWGFGEWVTNEIYVKVNTSGVRNGEYRHWVKRKGDAAGILVGTKSGILWTGPDPDVGGSSIPYYKIHGSWWTTTYGGSTYEFASPDNHIMYYDNFIMSKARITG